MITKELLNKIKYTDTQVVFREIPDEITLAINISNCPNNCKGCHSPELKEDIGKELTYIELEKLIENNSGITCVCFMGGDRNPEIIKTMGKYIKFSKGLKTAWYSGKDELPSPNTLTYDGKNHRWNEFFDYIKLGHYDPELGPLDSPNTNQRLYKSSQADTSWEDITYKFWK